MLSDVKEVEAGVQSLELGTKGKLLSFVNNFQQLSFAHFCNWQLISLIVSLKRVLSEISDKLGKYKVVSKFVWIRFNSVTYILVVEINTLAQSSVLNNSKTPCGVSFKY